jgi:hypothetical protein
MSTEEKPKASEPAENAEAKMEQVADNLEAEMEKRDEIRHKDERVERQDLNQGFDTGTHDSTHAGVNWPASYTIHPKANKPKEAPEEDKKK